MTFFRRYLQCVREKYRSLYEVFPPIQSQAGTFKSYLVVSGSIEVQACYFFSPSSKKSKRD
jgi:hypothetical protein